MLFYITVLVNLSLLGVEPPQGWLQDVEGYETVIECEDDIEGKLPFLAISLSRWSQGLGQIVDVQCMTEPEWIKKNNELGHETPKEYTPKEDTTPLN